MVAKRRRKRALTEYRTNTSVLSTHVVPPAQASRQATAQEGMADLCDIVDDWESMEDMISWAWDEGELQANAVHPDALSPAFPTSNRVPGELNVEHRGRNVGNHTIPARINSNDDRRHSISDQQPPMMSSNDTIAERTRWIQSPGDLVLDAPLSQMSFLGWYPIGDATLAFEGDSGVLESISNLNIDLIGARQWW